MRKMTKRGPELAVPLLNGSTYFLGGVSSSLGGFVGDIGAAFSGASNQLGATIATYVSAKKGGGAAGGGYYMGY